MPHGKIFIHFIGKAKGVICLISPEKINKMPYQYPNCGHKCFHGIGINDPFMHQRKELKGFRQWIKRLLGLYLELISLQVRFASSLMSRLPGQFFISLCATIIMAIPGF
jgi:hypothetical protein